MQLLSLFNLIFLWRQTKQDQVPQPLFPVHEPHNPTHFGSHLLDPLCFPKAHLDMGGPKFDLVFHVWLHQPHYIHYIIHSNVKGGQPLPFFCWPQSPQYSPACCWPSLWRPHMAGSYSVVPFSAGLWLSLLPACTHVWDYLPQVQNFDPDRCISRFCCCFSPISDFHLAPLSHAIPELQLQTHSWIPLHFQKDDENAASQARN